MNKYKIKKLQEPTSEYKFNVREFTSIDEGKTFYYTGNGRFFKTLEEANTWIRHMKEI